MPRVASQAARALTALGLVTAFGCKSAEEECEEARAAAERAWQVHVSMLEGAQKAALATQAGTLETLTKTVEPRLSQAAAKSASQRYERNTDAWQRAYQASQSAACSGDAECSKLKQDHSDARELAFDLVHKLEQARAALAGARQGAASIEQSAADVTPEQGNSVLQNAKLASGAAAEACRNVAK